MEIENSQKIACKWLRNRLTKCSTSLTIRKYVKTSLQFHFTTVRRADRKKEGKRERERKRKKEKK